MRYVLTLVLCTTLSLSYGQWRATKWGMTQEEVIKSENLVKYDRMLDYKRNELSQSITLDKSILEITYFFENGKLSSGMYSFKPLDATEENSYLKLWEQTKINLVKKFGDKFKMVGESLNWEIEGQKIKAFHLRTAIKDAEFIYVIYDSPKLDQSSVL